MSFGNEFEKTISSIKFSLAKTKYKLFAGIFALISFASLYFLLVSNVAENDINISVMMSGPGFVTFSIVTSIITSIFSGILLSMILFKFSNYKKSSGKGIFGFIGSGIVAFGVGCPTCGAFLFGLIGLPLALMYLPFRGLELQVLGILILLISIYFTGKSINGACKIKSK